MKLPNRNKARLAVRREQAAVRQAEHAVLTPQQKLAKLDKRLGAGVGAVVERKKLQDLITQGNSKPVSKETAEAVFGVSNAKASAKGKKQPKTK